MTGEDFEAKLKDDLPRGLNRPKPMRGKDRGLWSRWLSAEEMQPRDDNDWVTGDGLLGDTFMLGRRGGRVIGWKDDRHLMLAAGSRSGKGVSLRDPEL